ncbi:MAG: hypothetical protein EOO27_20170 [Comamonadaceae bacterium]|nr:MAG: hypothetical protein EOO27_20170 [Comamonadaceae bacterium]
MALNPFAAQEQRINSAVLGRLANAQAVYQGGEPFAVVFDSGAAEMFGDGGEVADLPEYAVSLYLGKTPGLAEGSKLTIDGKAYTVAGGVQPDSSGWVERVPLALLKG